EELAQRENHVAVEVKLRDKWRLYDPLYGSYFVDPNNERAGALSAEEARSVEFTPIVNPHNLDYRMQSQVGDPFNFLRLPNVDETPDGKGMIRIYLSAQLSCLPNYVGDNKVGGSPEGISFHLEKVRDQFGIEIDVT